MRRSIAALTLALALGCASALPASAGVMGPGEGEQFEVAVTLSKKPPAFHGVVKSQNDFCLAERSVKLKKDIRGRKNPTVGQAVTDLDGDWKFKVKPLKSGAYYAKAPRYGSASLGIECGPAVSRTVVVD
jgi:hypothetical protein